MNANKRHHRFVPIAGALNFRDFGGYSTTDGGRVRTGCLFRCGALAFIRKSEWPAFERLDIGVICDLRREDEVATMPTPDAHPFHCRVHIPVAPGSSGQLSDSFSNTGHTREDRAAFMKAITREIARDHSGAWRRLFRELLGNDGAFLLHCTAGKDRTGFGTALIHSALGVSETDIFSDYLLTNSATELFDYMIPRFRESYGDTIDEASIRLVAGVRREFLEAAFDQIRQDHGSVTGYLDFIGVDRNIRRELKKRFVEY